MFEIVEEEILTPSYHGEQCRHNGNQPEYEIACDNCDYFYWCFPDADKLFRNPEQYLNPQIYQLKTAPDEALQVFLQAGSDRALTEKEREIHGLVLAELVSRR